jgi:hypothetical protein
MPDRRACRLHVGLAAVLALSACGPADDSQPADATAEDSPSAAAEATPPTDAAAANPGEPPPFDPAAMPTTWDPGDFAAAEEQYQARLDAAGGGMQHTAESAPDWSGLWENAPGSSFSLRPGEEPTGRGFSTATTMRLTPLYAAEHEYRIRKGEAGEDFDPLTYCLPSGFPRWLVEPFMKEFVATPDQVWLMNEAGAEVRRIYTDGRGHIPAEFAYPMWFGDSIGFWDGDTLVIHTNNIKANLLQREQPAISDRAETVEEWTEISEGIMEVKGSLYDPEALLEPFHFVRYYRQVPNPDRALRIIHWSCAENQPVVRTAQGGSDFGALPGTEEQVDLTDPEVWLGFEEARELGLVEEFEARAAAGAQDADPAEPAETPAQ